MNRGHAILLLILLLALALRLWAIDFGLPYQYHQDEAHEVYRALRLGKGEFDFTRTFKGGYFYLLFIEYGFYFLVLWFTGRVSNPGDFAAKFIIDPTPFWLLGRLTTALIGTLSVYALYRLGKKAYGEKVSLLAALFLAVAVVHVECSHYITVDVPMAFFLILATSALVDVSRERVQHASLLAGLWIGIAMLFKMPAILAVIPFVVAHWRNGSHGRGRMRAMKSAALGLAMLGLVYLAGNPGIWLGKTESLSSTLKYIFAGTATNAGEADPVTLVHYSDEVQSLWRFYLEGLERSLGLGLLTLSFLGILRTLRRLTKVELTMLGFALPYFAIISASKTLAGPHYLIPLLPFLALLAARLLAVQWPTLGESRFHFIPVVLLLLITLEPLYRSAAFDACLARPDTRTLAKQWIEAHIPAGTQIVIDKGRYRSHWAPPLEESREALQRMLDATDEPSKREFIRQKMQHLSGITYDLISTVWGTEVETVDDYKARGVEYFVISEDVRNRFRRSNVQHLFPKAVAFYASLETRADVVLVQTFDPAVTEGPGPCINVYRLLRDGATTAKGRAASQ